MRPRPDLRILLAVFCGGTLGTLARAGLEETLRPRAGTWPWATFAVNLAGAFLLGLIVSRLAARTRSERRTALLGPGLCGGLTTFSTLQLELLELLDGGHVALALGYALASLVCGLALAALALHLGEERQP